MLAHLRFARGPFRLTAVLFLSLGRAGFAASAEPTATSPAAAGPHLAVTEPEHDFGTVPQGPPLRHAFTLSNSGSGVLQISEVKPACGCTTAEGWPHTLKPGESGTLSVTLDTTHFVGPITKAIAIHSNDSSQRIFTVQLKATLWTPVSIANPVLIFPAATDPRQVATRSTTIRNRVEGALVLSELRTDNPRFEPRLKEIVPGQEFELTVATRAPLGDGTQTGRITMKTSNPKMPEITVQAVVTLLPAIQVAPGEFPFTARKLAAAEKRYAVILNHRGANLQVSDVATDAPGVQLATAVSGDGKQYTVTLTFPAGFEIRPGARYSLRGRTNQPVQPTFEIPIVYAGDR